MREKKKIYYGVWIVVASFFIMGGAVGIAWNCNSLFIKAICEDTGYARSEIIILTTLLSAVTMLMSLFINKLYAKFRTASLIKIMAVLLPVFYCGISYCQKLWQFYLVQFGVSLAVFLSSTIPLSVVVGNWFKKKYGTALGIALMGSGVFGMIFNAVVGMWLPVYGWRVTYRILAICIAVLIIPPALLILKNAPKDMGLTAYGEDDFQQNKGKNASNSSLNGPMFRDIVKKPSFWLLCIALFFSMVAMNAQIQAVSPRLTDLHYSVQLASIVSALGMGSLAVGKVALGWFYDKLSAQKATVLAYLLGILALLGEALAGFAPMMALIVLGEGVSCAMGSVGLPVMVRYVYGDRDYNSIYGKLSSIANFGGMVGPLFLNAMYDKMGSYDVALWICIAMSTFSIFVTWFVLHPKRAAS